ncbi:MAG: hypothetical protein IJ031_03990, partial [Oscillospiraceae bacterium]|nr:hypothetical protein [Oscillospiraceae bacterium]
MRFSLKKAVASLVAGIVLVTTLAVTPIFAATSNKITISTSKSTAKPGESFDATVGFTAGDDGVAAYDLVLVYDSSKLTVNSTSVPSSSFMTFDPVSNTGKIRFQGVSSGNSFKSNQNLLNVSFKVKSGVTGSSNLYITVNEITTVD